MRVGTRPLSDRAEEVMEALWEELVEGGEQGLATDHPRLSGFEAELDMRSRTSRPPPRAKSGAHAYRARSCPGQRAPSPPRRVPSPRRARVQGRGDGDRGLRHRALPARGSGRGGVHAAGSSRPLPPRQEHSARACCDRARVETGKDVVALSDLRPGQSGRIAYVQTGEARRAAQTDGDGRPAGQALQLIQGFPRLRFPGRPQPVCRGPGDGPHYPRAPRPAGRAVDARSASTDRAICLPNGLVLSYATGGRAAADCGRPIR